MRVVSLQAASVRHVATIINWVTLFIHFIFGGVVDAVKTSARSAAAPMAACQGAVESAA
jgi:hypothetical protein